jgi:hypothetical protein
MYEIFDGLRWLKVLVRKRKAGSSSSGARRMLSHGIQADPREGVIIVNENERVASIDGELKIVRWK